MSDPGHDPDWAAQPIAPIPEAEARVVAHYRKLWQQHGEAPQSLDWSSATTQQRRFAVLVEGLDLRGQRVLDVGCGLGHLADWLQHAGVAVRYTGLDLTPDLLAAASRRHPQHRFVLGSVLDAEVLRGARFDVVLSSGLFYTYPEGGMSWLQRAVARMWSWTDQVLAFNSLSTWAARREPGEFQADPAEVLHWCGSLSTRLLLRHDYHDGDFTVQMFRGAADRR